MKLFSGPLSMFGAKAEIALREKGVEFELEMYPDLAGWKLFKDSMMGATPALAPGAMVQIGLIGLAWTLRHPAFKPKDAQTLEG